MNEFVKTYEVVAKVKTPIYIGDGTMLYKQDYYIDDKEKKVYVIDINKLIKKSSRILLKYEEFIKSDKTFNEWVRDDMAQYLNVDIIKKEYCKYIIDIGDVDLRGGDKKVTNNKKANKSNNINRFVKTPYGEPYIPGSSLKGVLRTIVLSNLLLSETKDANIGSNINDIKENINMIKNNRYAKNIESRYFNKLERNEKNISDAVNDIFSFISISDSDSTKIDSLVLCEKTDIGIDKTNNRNESRLKQVVVRECLKPETEIKFRISVYENENVYKIEKILEMIKNYSKNYLQYLNKYFKEPLSNYKGVYYIPIGGGVGYISKTIVEEAVGMEKGAKYISEILDKMFRNKGHYNDYIKSGFAPRLEKSTKIDGDTVLMGLLEIKNIFEPKKGIQIL